jgi:Tfp pilus assembly major pilin PilA
MKRKQAGVSLSGLLVAAFILAVVALLGMKVVPEVIEYFQIVKAVKSITSDPGPKNSVADVRKAFDRHATIDNISSIGAQDLDITKEGGEVVVSFAYEKRVPLFGNVSLLLYFEGSSKE